MMQQNINVEVINQMEEKIEEQSMFKQIINTLEESIIIAQDSKIEIVNDTFLNQYGGHIYKNSSSTTQNSAFKIEQSTYNQAEKTSIFRKIVNCIKTLKQFLQI
jgi:hypothetical protein